VLLTIACAAFLITINLTENLYELLVGYIGVKGLKYFTNCFFFSMTGLLWLVYNRWHETAKRQEDLETVISGISPDALLVVDSERRIRMCNASVKTMFGYELKEVLHQTTDLLYSDRRTDHGKGSEIFEQIEKEGYHIGTATGKKKNGEPLPLEIITGNLSDREGVVLLLRDITERKQAEDQLNQYHQHLEELVDRRTRKLKKEIGARQATETAIRKLNEELERRVKERTREVKDALSDLKRLDEMKDSFLSSVSHELRTPLTSIRSFAEILLQYEYENPETRKEFIEIIKMESDRLTRLINDFLDLSKIEAGMMVYNDAPISLEDLTQKVIKSHEQLFQRKSLRVCLDFPLTLSHVIADRDRVHQVLTNLLANAIKFSPPGGEIRIEAKALEKKRSGDDSNWVKVSVSDQGIGIDPCDFDTIFNKFRQISGDTLKDKPKGSGLGLSICKEIVSHYQGNIWVASQKGKGSTFFFTLPTAAPAAAKPKPFGPTIEEIKKVVG